MKGNQVAKGKGKGSSFEREMCKVLSLWWSKGRRDDIYWRTAGSGARAKVRSKTKQTTFGQYGDIQATDPIGQPLIDLCTIELKRGYSTSTFADLLEPPTRDDSKPGIFENFILQATMDSKNAKTPYWMLIVKRNRREAFVLIPSPFHDMLQKYHAVFWMSPKVKIKCSFTNGRIRVLFGTTLSNFLAVVKPKTILQICNDT